MFYMQHVVSGTRSATNRINLGGATVAPEKRDVLARLPLHFFPARTVEGDGYEEKPKSVPRPPKQANIEVNVRLPLIMCQDGRATISI